jgi:hypothetical protein
MIKQTIELEVNTKDLLSALKYCRKNLFHPDAKSMLLQYTYGDNSGHHAEPSYKSSEQIVNEAMAKAKVVKEYENTIEFLDKAIQTIDRGVVIDD